MILKKQLQMNGVQSIFKTKKQQHTVPCTWIASYHSDTVFQPVLVCQARETKTPRAEIQYYLVTCMFNAGWVYASLTFLNRNCWIRFLVCTVYGPAQLTGSRGEAALGVSPAKAGSVLPTWWVLCVKVIAVTPDFLIPPPSLGRCYCT